MNVLTHNQVLTESPTRDYIYKDTSKVIVTRQDLRTRKSVEKQGAKKQMREEGKYIA